MQELNENKELFDAKSKAYEEFLAKGDDAKFEEMKKNLNEESDRLRDRKKQVEQKVNGHN